jgi:hypothetical protein
MKPGVRSAVWTWRVGVSTRPGGCRRFGMSAGAAVAAADSRRSELLDGVPVWPDLGAAQTAIDAFRHEYNTDRRQLGAALAVRTDRGRRTRTCDGIHRALTLSTAGDRSACR